jgi:hypothetical protein
MACQRVIISDGRVYLGQNLRFNEGRGPICYSQDGVGQIIADCWESGDYVFLSTSDKAPCIGAGQSFVIQTLPDHLCPNCLDNPPPPPDGQWDCINGECQSKELYGTPGQFPSLQACTDACGNGCEGECVSAAEMAEHKAAVEKVKNTFCK